MAFALVLLDGNTQQNPFYLPGNAGHIFQFFPGYTGFGSHGQRHRHHGNAVIGIELQRGHHLSFGQYFGLGLAFKNTGIDGSGIHTAFHNFRRQPQTVGRCAGKAESAGIGCHCGINTFRYFAGKGQPNGLDDGGHRFGAGSGFAPQAGQGSIIAVAGVMVNAKVHHGAILFLQAAQHPGRSNIYRHHIFHRPIQHPAGAVIAIQVVILFGQRIGTQHPHLFAQVL